MATSKNIAPLTAGELTAYVNQLYPVTAEAAAATFLIIDDVNLTSYTDRIEYAAAQIEKAKAKDPAARVTLDGFTIRIDPAAPEESDPMNPSNTSKIDGAELAAFLATRFPTPATQPTTEEAAPMNAPATETIKTLSIENLIKRAGHIPAELIRSTVAQFGDWLYFQESAANINDHGAAGGFSGFSYYHDTIAFFDANREPILKMAAEMAADRGCKSSFDMMAAFNCFAGLTDQEIFNALIDPEAEEATTVKNGLAWFALEEVARAVYDYQNDDDAEEEPAEQIAWEAEEEQAHPITELCRSWLNGNISWCIEETKR